MDYPLNGLKNIEKDKGVLNGIGVKTPINHLTDKTKYIELKKQNILN